MNTIRKGLTIGLLVMAVSPSNVSFAKGCSTNGGVAVTNGVVTVRDVQYMLRRAGVYFGPINGIVDCTYHRAVGNLQAEIGATIDGFVGSDTLTALRDWNGRD
jgi:hypothetical protein